MGKKGKNKNQTTNTQNAPKLEGENTEKDERKQETVTEIPKVEELKIEPEKVEKLKIEPEKIEALTEEGIESTGGTLKSKKRRNRKKKNTATGEIDSDKIEESKEEKAEIQKEKLEPNENKSEPPEENTLVEVSKDTLKKKRRRNRKKNVCNVGDVQEENVKEIIQNEPTVEIVGEKSGESNTTSSQQNTLKRKRNRNKNKTVINKEQNESIVKAVEKSLENELPQQIEAKCGQKEKPEPQRRGKKQKRFDLSSKKTISDELQERQEREQKEARDHIKNEIAKREKLLETIDLVLDCHKTEVELAKNQQESLKDVKMLSQEASKIRPQALPSKAPKQSSSKKSTPVEEELANKIEQVLGMTKLEIKNAQTQQAYVNRLEAEVAKVKQSKDILLGGQPSSVVPPHIQKMAKEMRDIGKGDIPKTKEELIKEIESRDTLMSEINRVLDNTKSEINKVQKQQKIIQNLEVELHKMKDQEIVEKLMGLEQEELEEDEPQEPPPPKQSPATASLLDALMANVGKLKEIQAMKEKQKAEKTTIGVCKEIIPQEISESIQKPDKLNDVEAIVEKNAEASSSVAHKQEIEMVKSPQKDAKKINDEKKHSSLEGSPKEQKKHPKDQKKQPQKVHETKPKAEVLINSENKKDEIFTKIDSAKECGSVEVKQHEKKDQLFKEDTIEVSEKVATMDVDKSKTDVIEPTKQEKPESPKKEPQKKKDHNKDIRKSEKRIENTSFQEKNIDSTNQKKDNDEKTEAKEIFVPDQKKVEPLEAKSDKKLIKDIEPVVPVEVKEITSAEPATKEFIKNKDEQKKNEKEQKTSLKSSHKNRNHKHDKKDVLKGVPEVVSPIPITAQKPSMAEMLKNAPDPSPDEINKKLNEEIKVEAAPLARPESAIIEVKPSEQIKEIMQPIMKEAIEEKNMNEIAKVLDDTLKVESEIQDDEIVIVNKVEIEAEIKEEKLNEQDLTDPKNVQRGGFVSPVDDKDAKSLKKDEKQHANKVKSPIKASTRSSVQKVSDGKAAQQNKTISPKPKLEAQAKINSKPMDAKKMQQLPTKPLSPTLEKPQSKFEIANSVSNDIPSSPKIDTQNTSHDISPSSTEKPKIPPRPDVTKTSNLKPAPRAGNVTNQSSSPIKTKTPSPSKSPSVAKTASTSTAQSQTHAAKPKPTVSQTTRQSATSKPPINTKSTNQKPLATPQKVNSTKPSTPKPSSSMCDSVFRLQQLIQNNIYNKKTFSQPAFRIRKMDEKSMNPIKQPLTTSNSDNNTNQTKALLTKDDTIKIILPSTLIGNLQENFFSKDVTETSSSSKSKNEKPIQLFKKGIVLGNDIDECNDSQYSEYKITPRQIFCASICQVCKVNLSRYFLCIECKMVAYCKEEHMKIDYLNHKGLCIAIQLIAKRRGGHVYNMAKHLTSMEFRNLRLHTISLCEQFLNRTLLTFEREVFLFPRLCHYDKCREWRCNLLRDCEKCGQISFCSQHPLNESHKLICNSYALFQRILLHEKSYGKINIALPQKVLKKIPILTNNVQDIMQLLYKNVTAFQDECINAALMQIATAPLTTFYSIQNVGFEFMERLTIHFVGAELKFEGDRLQKWESLFLHLAHGITDLEIIFIGSELNYENLPVEIISRTRVCKTCRQNCRGIRFDFQCKQFYHDYCGSTAFVKPDFVCFLNPALHRAGFCGFDTWPKTIEASLKNGSPILVTSTTKNECYLDLDRIKKVTNNEIEILIPPIKNPYASTRPERNFASDGEDPIMFKNNYLFVIAKTQDLIDL